MKRILIADDSATARMFVQRCLEIARPEDLEFSEAENGEEALSLLQAEGADLLVSDLAMPTMDGRDLLRRITASPVLHGLPVLVITSSWNESVEEELKDLGATAILAKPISPSCVAEVLEKIWPEGEEQ